MHADATFKITPPFFYQTLVIFTNFRDHIVPVTHALMSNKNAELYKEVFSALKVAIPKFQPTQFMSNFENGLVKGATETWEGLAAVGCQFHFSQAIIRRKQKIDLSGPYKNDEDVSRAVKNLLGLSLLPPEAIRPTFRVLKHTLSGLFEYEEEVTKLYSYFEKYWIQSVGLSRFSVYRKEEGKNNLAELCNRHIKNKFRNPNHPNAWYFAEGLAKHLSVRDAELLQLENGFRLTHLSRNQSSGKCDRRRLEGLWNRLESGQLLPLDFLKQVKHFFHDQLPAYDFD